MADTGVFERRFVRNENRTQTARNRVEYWKNLARDKRGVDAVFLAVGVPFILHADLERKGVQNPTKRSIVYIFVYSGKTP